MSKQVHCPECQSENTPGSKFCNNCGARLPKSTSVLCPKCQTPNPHNNFYCDNCGSRLHPEQSNIEPEEDITPEANDLPTSAKMFTLPTRDPGDTGELDPGSLQEWLKNQSEESEKQEGSGKLPRLSDLTPEERGKKDDLPGWLIDTENDVLSGSPDDITTEHFLHLIQDIDEEEREKLSGLLNDPSITGDAANLPDWLKDVTQTGQKESQSIPDSADEKTVDFEADSTEGGDADWLFEMDESADEASIADQEAVSPEDPDEVPDWLGERGPPKTALLGKSDEVELPSAPSELDEGDLPDWLMSETESQETTAATSESDRFEEDVPDWMSADAPQDEDLPTKDDIADLTLDEAAATSLTGWLAEFDVDDEAETTVTPEDTPTPEDEAAQGSLTDWLTAFDEEDLAAADEASDSIPEEQSVETEESLPDWLTGGDEPDDIAEDASFDELAADLEDVDETASSDTDLLKWLSDSEDVEDSQVDDEPIEDSFKEIPSETEDFDWLSEVIEEETTPDDQDEPSGADALAEWLDSDISTDASLSVGDTGPLPDWLDDLSAVDDESASQIDSSELDSSLTELFGETTKDATGELDWLDDEEDEVDTETDDPSLAPLIGAAGVAAAAEALSQDDEASLDDDPDWLSELAAFDPDEIEEIIEDEETTVSEDLPELEMPESSPEAVSEDDFDVDAILAAADSDDADIYEIDDELLGISDQEAGDWADIDGILAGTADDEELPDWLEQLDDVDADETIAADSDSIPPEEIPDWVANMRPGETGKLSSVLPSALLSDSDTGELLSETSDLADADLPDWLDGSLEQKGSKTDAEAIGWFDSAGTGEETPSELEAILADLPPAPAPEDMLQKAEIPDWLEELKPRELTGEAAPLTESRLESSGPLAGMPNTIAVEPIIAMPRAATTLTAYTISAEQAQQARLLKQLAHEEAQPPKAVEPSISARGVAWLRILVALLLLAAVFAGLYGPAVLKSKAPPSVPPPAAAINTAVSESAGQTVLVAFEYTPALAGELNPEAEVFLAQVEAVGSPILITSQYAAGTAVAEILTDSQTVTHLGLIPGEAMGLRQLGNCLGENALVSPCTSLHNLTVGEELATSLADVGLIIVLTGERSSLVNWIEQVSTSADVPIVVGTTQALEPVVVPYYASAQVQGYLNGLPATTAYQQAYVQMADNSAESIYGAQSFVLLVTAVILLIGGLAFSSGKKKS